MDLEKEKTEAEGDDAGAADEADSQCTIHNAQLEDGDADAGNASCDDAGAADDGVCESGASCDEADSQCTMHNAQLEDEDSAGDDGEDEDGASCDDAGAADEADSQCTMHNVQLEDGDADAGESESEGEDEPPPVKKAGVKLIVPEHTRRLPLTVIAALLGVVAGSIPVVLLTYITNITFYPLFIIAPLLIHLLNSVFKGCRDVRAFIVNAVFSLAGMYTTAVACQAALYTSLYGISISWIPRLTAMAFGQPKVLPSSASAYMYLFVFTILGICITWELLRAGMGAQRVVSGEPGEACGDEDDANSQFTIHNAQLGDEDAGDADEDDANSQFTMHNAQFEDEDTGDEDDANLQCTMHNAQFEDDAGDDEDDMCDAQPEVGEAPECETADVEAGDENGASRAPVQ